MLGYSQVKTTMVGFIFIGPNALSQAEHLEAVNHMTQAGDVDVKVHLCAVLSMVLFI